MLQPQSRRRRRCLRGILSTNTRPGSTALDQRGARRSEQENVWTERDGDRHATTCSGRRRDVELERLLRGMLKPDAIVDVPV